MKYRDLLKDSLDKSSVLLTFHGCSHENARGICSTGYATGIDTSAKCATR